MFTVLEFLMEYGIQWDKPFFKIFTYLHVKPKITASADGIAAK